MDLRELQEAIISGYRIGFDEAMALAANYDAKELGVLANSLRIHYFGNTLDTCSIMNARSGKCSEDCKWCSQSKFHSSAVEVYPLVSYSAIEAMAQGVERNGVKRFSLVTSGKAVTGADLDRVCDSYSKLSQSTNLYLCASMGLVDLEGMQKLYQSGVRRYHCNMESSRDFFAKLCTTHSYDEKIATIRYAQQVGMEVCSGGIIGMGETLEDRINLALTLREMDITSIPINVLNPIKGTALEGTAPLSTEEILQCFALFKIINPTARVRFAAGRAMFSHVQQSALQGGVDAAMVGDLLTTVGSDTKSDRALFEELGLNIDY